jgi:Rieske Fe-S protein
MTRREGKTMDPGTEEGRRACPCRSGIADRRTILKAAIGLQAGLAAAPPALAQGDPRSQRPRPGDLLVLAEDAGESRPLTVDDLQVGAEPVEAWAMDPASNTVRSGSRLNKVLLLRLDPAQLSDETRQKAAEGLVAFSAVCTHTGCDVTVWHADRQILECPCHFSQFDPKQRARVVGGPAPRRLPGLPLRAEGRRLVVAALFDSRPGFEQS